MEKVVGKDLYEAESFASMNIAAFDLLEDMITISNMAMNSMSHWGTVDFHEGPLCEG